MPPTKGETAELQSEEKRFVLELNYYEKNSPYNYPYVVGEGLDHPACRVENLDKALEEACKADYPTILMMKNKGDKWTYVEDPD